MYIEGLWEKSVAGWESVVMFKSETESPDSQFVSVTVNFTTGLTHATAVAKLGLTGY